MTSTMIGIIRSDLTKLVDDFGKFINERDELALRLVDKQKELDAALERNVTLSAALTTERDRLATAVEALGKIAGEVDGHWDAIAREALDAIESPAEITHRLDKDLDKEPAAEADTPREITCSMCGGKGGIGAGGGRIGYRTCEGCGGSGKVKLPVLSPEAKARVKDAVGNMLKPAKVGETQRVIDERIEKFLVERVALDVRDGKFLVVIMNGSGPETFVDAVRCKSILREGQR